MTQLYQLEPASFDLREQLSYYAVKISLSADDRAPLSSSISNRFFLAGRCLLTEQCHSGKSAMASFI
jgi:hypothetical protein